MDAALGKVCDVLGFSTLNEYQENALKFVIEKKKDVYVVITELYVVTTEKSDQSLYYEYYKNCVYFIWLAL